MSEAMTKKMVRFMEGQVQALTAALGRRQTKKLLAILAIDMSKISESEPMQRRLIDAVHVVGRAFSAMSFESVFEWLVQPEPLLGNRLPLNVLGTPNGVRAVEDALDAVYAGVLV